MAETQTAGAKPAPTKVDPAELLKLRTEALAKMEVFFVGVRGAKPLLASFSLAKLRNPETGFRFGKDGEVIMTSPLIDEIRKNPHAKLVAEVAASRGDENFPPEWVVEFFRDPADTSARAAEDAAFMKEVLFPGLAFVFEKTGVVASVPSDRESWSPFLGMIHAFDFLRKNRLLSKLGLGEKKKRASDARSIIQEMAEEARAEETPERPVDKLYRRYLEYSRRQQRRRQQTSRESAAAPMGSGTPSANDLEVLLPVVGTETEVEEDLGTPLIGEEVEGEAGDVVPADLETPEEEETEVEETPQTVSEPAAPVPTPAVTATPASDDPLEVAMVSEALESLRKPVATAIAKNLRDGKITVAEATTLAAKRGYTIN